MMDLEIKKFLKENSPVLRISLKSKSYAIGQIEEMIEKNKNLLCINTRDSIFLSFKGEKYEEDIYDLAIREYQFEFIQLISNLRLHEESCIKWYNNPSTH